MGKTTLALNQPVYLPWLGYFEQIARVDQFVFFDDAQYTKQDWRNRNQILAPDGPIFLTVPIRRKNLGTAINQIQIDDTQPWVRKHLNSIRMCYGRAPYFDETFGLVSEILQRRIGQISDLDVALTQAITDALGLITPTSLSSQIPRNPDFYDQNIPCDLDDRTMQKNLRVIEVCRHHGADVYYSGARAHDYIDLDLFKHFGIDVVFQDYAHPTYQQQRPEFSTHMSIIDLLMNLGPGAKAVLLSSPFTDERFKNVT